MLVSVEDVVNKSVDDGRLADCLVPQENYLVLEEGRDCSFGEI